MLLRALLCGLCARRRLYFLWGAWPCQPYSAARRVTAATWREGQRECASNTALVVEVLVRAVWCSAQAPLLILLENVPGFVDRGGCAWCRDWLAAEMESMPYSWGEQVLCPAANFGCPMARARWYAVGVRRDVM